MESVSEAYKARCIKRLNEWSAPLSDWRCIYTYDVMDEDNEREDAGLFICELCDCPQVRYVHVMFHEHYFEEIHVGCICAGIMESDMLAAKAREREMKNRAKRKANYLKREWQWRANGNRTLKYKNRRLTITPSRSGNGGYGVVCDGRSIWNYKGKRIANQPEAIRAAFDLVDPPIGGRRA